MHSFNLLSRPGKIKTKAYSGSHFPRTLAAATKAGAAKDRHCLISFGCFCGRPIPFYSSSSSLFCWGMVRRGPGQPRSTPAARHARLSQRTARLRLRAAQAAHLRTTAALVALRGPRCSLRVQYLCDNAALLHHGEEPFYFFILLGEAGYWDAGAPPDGYRTVVT